MSHTVTSRGGAGNALVRGVRVRGAVPPGRP